MTSPTKRVLTSLIVLAAALCLQPATAASSSARVRRQEQRVYGPPGAGVPRPDPRAGEAKWERYAFPGDEFSVELPGMPFVFHTRRVIGESGRDSDSMRVFGHYFDGVVFMVVSYDRPRPGETLEDFAGYPWNRPPPAATKEIKLDGFGGKQYGDATRVFKTNARAYLVRAFYSAERKESAQRFLDSLRLSASPQGQRIIQTLADTHLAAPGPGRGEGTNARDAKGQPPPPPPQLADDDPARVFNMKDVTHKAVIVYKGDPGFSEEARQNNVTGVVRLRAILRPTGRLTDVSVIKTLPAGLTERAVYAARHMLFFPAVKDGRAVAQYVTLEYNFNIY